MAGLPKFLKLYTEHLVDFDIVEEGYATKSRKDNIIDIL